jgi:uncharacterized protein RhaS with RHS repeats
LPLLYNSNIFAAAARHVVCLLARRETEHVTTGGTYYFLSDGLGSTLALVDSTGTVQGSYTYDAYGKATASGTVATEYQFAGQQTDASGLQYLRARYYDPGHATTTRPPAPS